MRRAGPTVASFALLLCALSGAAQTQSQSQTPTQAQADPSPNPSLPDIATLMRQVEANERKAETIQRDYIYDETNSFEERDSHEHTKKSGSREREIFWLNDVPVGRTLKKDGKPLTEEEKKKESERIDGIVQRAKDRRARADSQGKETDARGHDELTFARMLELGSFSNPRREAVHGRDTILVDYVGNPKAKTHNYAEGLFRELSGTIWVDEHDRTLQHLDGRFDHDFKVALGLGVNVKQGTWFKATFVKINDEVWLPETIEGDGHARYLLFLSLSGHFKARTSNYRKFKATSTILPDITTVDPEAPEAPPAADPTSSPK